MAVYEYRGIDARGRNVRGIVDAESARQARAKLRRDGVYPSDLFEEHRKGDVRAAGGPLGRRVRLRTLFERVGVMDVSIVARQLSTLLGAGTPLVTALTAILEQQSKVTLTLALTQVRERVNEGSSLADALREHPRVFPELFVDMVRSGEASGALDVVLVRLADYLEEHARNVAKVRAVMTYPLIMLCVAGAVVFLIFTVAVPRLKQLFVDMGGDQALPKVTLALIAIGDFLAAWWWTLLIAGVLLAFVVRRYGRTPAGRRRLDALKLRTPVAGALLLKIAVARFARTLGTLLSSGIPILRALDIVSMVVQNRVLAEALAQAATSVEQGAGLSGPLRSSGLFPPILVHMVAVGEQSGQLEDMLTKVADAYDNEVETAMLRLTSLLEPFLVLVMAGVVVFIALAILLPIIQMNSMTSA